MSTQPGQAIKLPVSVDQFHSAVAGRIPERLAHVEEHGVPGKLIAPDIAGLSGPLEVGTVGLVFHTDTRAFISQLVRRYNSHDALVAACKTTLAWMENYDDHDYSGQALITQLRAAIKEAKA